MKRFLASGALFISLCSYGSVTTLNIAPEAKVTASSYLEGHLPTGVNDGLARVAGKGDWLSNVPQMFWGEIDFPWIRLDWSQPINVDKVVIYDQISTDSRTAGLRLRFSDGTKQEVVCIPQSGAAIEVEIGGKLTDYILVELTDGDGDNIGLSEIEVYPTPDSCGDYVSLVNPFIETTRGRYFFFISGCQPQGMIGAAPMTRNKNQGGGGYNYNDSHILGFPQIHAWMLSGLQFMPATTAAAPEKGESGWRSAFSHNGEIARPGYHRVYLDDYNVWVEQTATQRTSAYRMTYTDDTEANLLFILGGYVGTSTMVNADVKAVSPTRIEGSFDTTGRLWGGPDFVRVYFVADFDRPYERIDSWDGDNVKRDVKHLVTSTPSVARNEGMSYHDAPPAGLGTVFSVKKGEPLNVKMAISYVNVENARENMERESAGLSFDDIRGQAEQEWNDWFGKIAVSGGSQQQRIKFYTDLWHTLVGRHKINDCNGEYPDRTEGKISGRHMTDCKLKIKKVPLTKTGEPLFNMYNTDALWLTQWNQNTLWGLAWPALLDDFSASMIEYGVNGGLIPRGPCGGTYSFIMSGCPATSMITSAYQRGLHHKWNPEKAYPILKKNHEKGGMLGFNFDSEFDFYDKNGYAPEKGGLTVQWAFEDWALSQMARRMGKERDARKFENRAKGWRKCIHPDLHLLLPKRSDGSWLHTNPHSGWGFEEANSWQTTFGLSHDLPGLVEEMGGGDILCDMLNHAFEESVEGDFVAGYGNGYVSYANQPGLSTAHVFSHAGKPWLTQYWVREVKERAYGSISPSTGYGGHDEDQGQMSGVSALMAIGLFSVNGGSAMSPQYEITSPIFDEIVIKLNKNYYEGNEFRIKVNGNSAENCYIQRAELNGKPHNSFCLPHEIFAKGGTLELWMGDKPNTEWGLAD